MGHQRNQPVQILNASAERQKDQMGSLLEHVQKRRLRGLVVICMRLLCLLLILHIYSYLYL